MKSKPPARTAVFTLPNTERRAPRPSAAEPSAGRAQAAGAPPATLEDSEASATPKGPATTEASDDPATREASDDPATPDASDDSATPDASDDPATPDAPDNLATPEASDGDVFWEGDAPPPDWGPSPARSRRCLDDARLVSVVRGLLDGTLDAVLAETLINGATDQRLACLIKIAGQLDESRMEILLRDAEDLAFALAVEQAERR